jgi:hypothetical protein
MIGKSIRAAIRVARVVIAASEIAGGCCLIFYDFKHHLRV